MKLHQIIAVVAGKKSRAQQALTQQHHGWKAEMLSGITRVYAPLDEDGAKLPPESQRVQMRVDQQIEKLLPPLTTLYDVVATQETGNTQARATVVIGGIEVLTDVPVTVLLFLEKQLTDLRTYIGKLPVLASVAEWGWDTNRGCYASKPTDTVKTAKTPTPVVLADATKEHPAQVQMAHTDTQVGTWTTTHLSGAIPADEKEALGERITALLDAVKQAREAANATEVEDVRIGEQVLDYVFGEFLKKRAQS
jgi:hypothetical protein